MEILKRSKLKRTIHLLEGDTLRVTHYDGGESKILGGIVNGVKVPVKEVGEVVLAETVLDASRAMSVDEVVLFATEFEGRRAIGGMVLEVEK
jgi:hypothetical protein